MANNYVEQDKRQRWDTISGWQTVRTWEGEESEKDDFLTTTLTGGYSALEISTTQDGWCTIVATYSASTPDGSEPPEDSGLVTRQWEMVVSEEEKPLILLPKVQALATRDPQWPLSIKIGMDQWAKALKLAIDAGEASLPRWEDFMPAAPATATEGEITEAVNFAQCLVTMDNPVFAVPVYVLRKIEVVQTWSALKAVHTNVNRFHTYAGILAAEPTLSGKAMLDVADLGPSGSVGAPGIGLFWLKRPPQVSQVTFGQMQIEQEYWGAYDYNIWIYGDPITS